SEKQHSWTRLGPKSRAEVDKLVAGMGNPVTQIGLTRADRDAHLRSLGTPDEVLRAHAPAFADVQDVLSAEAEAKISKLGGAAVEVMPVLGERSDGDSITYLYQVRDSAGRYKGAVDENGGVYQSLRDFRE